SASSAGSVASSASWAGRRRGRIKSSSCRRHRPPRGRFAATRRRRAEARPHQEPAIGVEVNRGGGLVGLESELMLPLLQLELLDPGTLRPLLGDPDLDGQLERLAGLDLVEFDIERVVRGPISPDALD